MHYALYRARFLRCKYLERIDDESSDNDNGNDNDGNDDSMEMIMISRE